MSRWFRHYAGMMRDDKLVRAALRAKQPVERVVWVWGAILESAAEIDDDGRYEVDHAEVAYFLRADESDIAAIEVALHDLGRVNSGCVAKWGARQFQSDRSAERQKRHRDRVRSRGDGGSGIRDAEVTTASRHGDAPETETDSSEANASAPPAVEPTDPVERLWVIGVRLFGEMGVPEAKAKPLIGRWLRDTANDHGRVLAAIQRARDHSTGDPIPLIARILKPINRTPSNGKALDDAFADLHGRAERFERGEPDWHGRPLLAIGSH